MEDQMNIVKAILWMVPKQPGTSQNEAIQNYILESL